MTRETLEKAKIIDNELRELSLENISGAHHIIPSSITFSFYKKDIEGIQNQCTTTVQLSDEMRQIIRQTCEDRIAELKKSLEKL